MKRISTALAVPLAAVVFLAGCAGTSGSAEPSDPAEKATTSDGGTAPMDDGGDDSGITDESEAWPEVDDEAPQGPFSPEGAVGGTLDGSVYTLGAPEPLPDDITALITDAGFPEKDLEDLTLLPVDIDNTKGSVTESIYSATAVVEGGDQYVFTTLGGYLMDVSDGYADLESSGMGDPVYDDLQDRAREELKEVAPTAQATVYLMIDGTPDPGNLEFTYFAVEPPMHGDPIPLTPLS